MRCTISLLIGIPKASLIGWTFLGPLGYLNAPRAMRQSVMPDPNRRQSPAVEAVRDWRVHETGSAAGDAVGLTSRRGQPLTSQAIGVVPRATVVIAPQIRCSRWNRLIDQTALPRNGSPQVSSSELDARSKLQILLELQRTRFIAELQDDIHYPRPMLRGVRTAPGVVSVEASSKVRSDASVVTRRFISVL